MTAAQAQLMDSIEGATIVSGDIKENEGLTLYFSDGRALIFVSESFALGLLRVSTEKLH